jgi:hypothetical protein
MGPNPPSAPKRRFAGLHPAAGPRQDGLTAVADALLSEAAAGDPDAARLPPSTGPYGQAVPETPVPPPEPSLSVPADDGLPPEADPPLGLYLLVPAGIETADRRRAALAVAASLMPPGRTAAVFLFEGACADAHILGEPACGRVGPQYCLDPADIGRAIAELVSRCDQVVVVPLDPARGVPGRLAAQARRTVFVAAADAESIVETYRELKAWRTRGLAAPASLFVVGTDGPDEAGRLAGRLRRASRRFLACDLANQGFLSEGAACLRPGCPEPLRILTRAPSDKVWPYVGNPACAAAAGLATASPWRAGPGTAPAAGLAGAAAGPRPAPADVRPADAPLAPGLGLGAAAGPAPSTGPYGAGDADAAPGVPCSVFAPWQPESRGALVAAVEAQAPALLGPDLRQVLRIDVDEPGAPPLAAVRQDGTLVAILLAGAGETVDTQAAARWLSVHRPLLARAYPGAGIGEGREPAAVVLAPLAPRGAPDAVRRFLAVKLGGHRGIVLLP